jgi:nucleoid-associated protein YgaU
MGLIDFVKDAGAKLFGKDDEPKVEAKPKAPAVSLDDIRAKALERIVRDNGFEVKDLDINVKGDRASVAGTVDNNEIREKVVLCCGNNAGIAQVDDRLTVENPEPEAKFYTVQSGDSLSKIAKEYYGNAMKYPVIFEANKPMLSDPDKIYPGQVLRIPPIED